MEGGGFDLMPRFYLSFCTRAKYQAYEWIWGKGPHPYFNPLFAAQSSTMLKGGWGAGGLWAHAQGFTSVSVPEPSTRLMSGSRGTHPDFNPASVEWSSTMLGVR